MLIIYHIFPVVKKIDNISRGNGNKHHETQNGLGLCDIVRIYNEKNPSVFG